MRGQRVDTAPRAHVRSVSESDVDPRRAQVALDRLEVRTRGDAGGIQVVVDHLVRPPVASANPIGVAAPNGIGVQARESLRPSLVRAPALLSEAVGVLVR